MGRKSHQLRSSDATETVTQQLTAGDTVDADKTTAEKTLTSLLFVYCVNMATGPLAKSLFEDSGQGTHGGGWRAAEDGISM